MGGRILDPKLMTKLAKKLGKRKPSDVNVIVSKRAAKLGISSEAALVILAKEQGIGTATYQRTLGAAKQAEVRDALLIAVSNRSASPPKSKTVVAGLPVVSKKTSLRSLVELIIQDKELRSRCTPTLVGKSNFDIAINQATLVLENRIRKKSSPPTRLVGENLVGYSFNEDLAKSRLRVVTSDPDDQRGFTQILRGLVPAFRHKTHHHLIDLSREEALSVCGFIDVLLRVVDQSVKAPE